MEVNKETIVRHTEADFIGMRAAGELVANVLDYITPYVVPGITTAALDDLCHKFIISHDAYPAPLNFKGYPKSICTSVNHVVCHGIPSEKQLKDGDIVNIDVTVALKGYHGDSSRMYFVGDAIPIKAKRLVQVTYDAMMRGIEVVKPGVKVNEIGRAIQQYVEKYNFSVVRDFCGHGIGKKMHMAPNIPHYYEANFPVVLEEGMFFTVEPMVNAGRYETVVLNDGWTAVTKDKLLSAQFEHTLAVTKDGFEIFTISPKHLHFPPYKVSKV